MSPKPTDLSRKIARDLLRIGAVKLSPVYCDNRLTLGYPDVRRDISAGFEVILRENSIPCDVIVGTATAGIPHAAWLSERMELPMAYVRSKAKEHGRGNQIEGLAPEGAHAVVIEDLVSTGMSSTAVLAPLAEAGVKVEAVMAIFTYGLVVAEAAFEEAGVPLYTLSDFPTLIEEAATSDSLSEDDIISLQAWYRNPARWSADRGGR
jgi:orotate phosphoribosyltransferase